MKKLERVVGSMAESVGGRGKNEAIGGLPQSGASLGSQAAALLDLVCGPGRWIVEALKEKEVVGLC
jgi:hypothetical protein